VNQTQSQAVQLDELLARQGAWQESERVQLRQAVFEWQDRRERVWYRAQALLWLANRADAERQRTASQFLQITDCP